MKIRLLFVTAIAAVMMIFSLGGTAHADWLCARVIAPTPIQPVACVPLP